MKPLPPKLRQALLYQLRAAVEQRPDALPPHGVNLQDLRARQFAPPNRARPGTPNWDEYYPPMEPRTT